MRDLVEVQKLIVDLDLRVVGFGRQQALHLGPDRGRAEKAQHGYPLVPLHHIEAVEVFHGGDRVPDTLLQMGGRQVGPLGRKLAVFLQQRIEGGREGLPPAGAAGSHHLVDIHADAAEIHLAEAVQVGQHLLQRREEGVLIPCASDFHFLEPELSGLLIGDVSHRITPFFSSCQRYYIIVRTAAAR